VKGRPVLRMLGSLLLILALAPPPARAAGAAVHFKAEPASSRVEFVLHTFWHDVTGATSAIESTLTSEGGDPTTDGVVFVSVEAGKIETGNKRRDAKMRERHLEVEKYPRLEFRSTAPPRPDDSGEKSENGAARLLVRGDLTIHGVTREISLPVEAVAEAGGWRMTGSALVKMSDYGVPDPSIALNRVRDEVEIRFDIRFAREKG